MLKGSALISACHSGGEQVMWKPLAPGSLLVAYVTAAFLAAACGSGEVKTYRASSVSSGNQAPKTPSPSPSPVASSRPSPSPSPSPSQSPGGGAALNGETLYTTKCGACHGAKAATTVDDKTPAGIVASYTTAAAMKSLTPPPKAEVDAISAYLLK